MNDVSPENVLVINPICSPMGFALYRNGKLAEEWKRRGYVSENLAEEIKELLERLELQEIVYINGPGSYMGIKLTYILLKTLEMLKGISFSACSAFALNGGHPLKAMGELYFVKEKETIITQVIKENIKL